MAGSVAELVIAVCEFVSLNDCVYCPPRGSDGRIVFSNAKTVSTR